MSPSTLLVDNPPLSRRGFLAGSSAGLAAATLGPRLAFGTVPVPADGDVIVVMLLRGGADGLSLVAPWEMPSYRERRPTIRVRGSDEVDPAHAGRRLTAGGAVGAFDLDGLFALHPGLAALHEGPWAAGDLAVVHAVGMPAAESDTRSHFVSLRNWEAGSASLDVETGFLNRFLESIGAVDGVPGIGRGPSLPATLGGAVRAVSMTDLATFGVRGFADNNRARTVLDTWYRASTTDPVADAGATTLAAIGEVAGIDWSAPHLAPGNGAVYGWDDIAFNLSEVAKLIRAEVGLRAAVVDVTGWDTHEFMGSPDDPHSMFRTRCSQLGGALAAFWQDLGGLMNGVTVVTISEFGRTIDENGSGGTDHGRGSVMCVMGGGIRGGVHGPFVPEIADGPEGDLAVLTDYRTVLAEVLEVRGGAVASSVFPTWQPQEPLGVCL